MRAAALLLLAALAAPCPAQDVDPSRVAFAEVVPERDTWYAGEWVRLEVRLGYDAWFFENHVVQPFQRELDVPVELRAAFLEGRQAQLTELPGVPLTVAVNGVPFRFSPDSTTVERDGRELRLIRSPLSFAADAPGDIDTSVSLRFTYATQFRDDFVEGRVAIDPAVQTISGPATRIRVLALPEEGRPDDFSGVVGQCSITAALRGADTARPGVVRVAVTVRCDAPPPAGFPMPSPAGLRGVHVLGSRRTAKEGGLEGRWTEWTELHELEVTDPAVTDLPPLAFTYFDPVEGAYRTVRTDPLPLPAGVRAADASGGTASGPEAPDGGPSALLLAAGAAALVLLIAGAVISRRARGAAAASPAVLAGAEARRALAAAGGEPSAALAAFLARRLGCEPAAVITPDLRQRLTAGGVPEDVAGRAAALLERLVAARYGGAPATADDLSAVRRVVDDCVAAWQ